MGVASHKGSDERECVITRRLDAPRALVFKAWTDPQHMAAWWGPHGFTTAIQEMDVRPGGAWRFIMYGPDGVDCPIEIIFHEGVKPERLVYSHGPTPRFHVTVFFDDENGKTRLRMRSLFPKAAERGNMETH